MADLFAIIPGYRDAVEREGVVRDASFVLSTDTLCGVSVFPMTPRHLAFLDLAGSPFLSEGASSAGDVAQFLWVVSLGFEPGNTAKRDKFIRGCRKLPALRARTEIERFVADTFQDAPAGSGRAGVPFASWLASLVDAFACEYHWSEAAILNTPLARLFQYLKCARKRHNPKAIMFNPSDKVRGDWLAEQNRKAQSN